MNPVSRAIAAPARVVRLRNSRRVVTRGRICDVAKELFFTRSLAAVTMEEIAASVGIRRSTLYLHFRDKEEILAEIARDYSAKLRAVIARIPAPKPTREQFATWVGEAAALATRERAPLELLASLSHLPKTPAVVVAFGEALKLMMAEKLPAFRRALEPGETLRLAWAMSALDTLGRALCLHARGGGDEFSRCRLAVAAEILSRFVHDEL